MLAVLLWTAALVRKRRSCDLQPQQNHLRTKVYLKIKLFCYQQPLKILESVQALPISFLGVHEPVKHG